MLRWCSQLQENLELSLSRAGPEQCNSWKSILCDLSPTVPRVEGLNNAQTSNNVTEFVLETY